MKILLGLNIPFPVSSLRNKFHRCYLVFPKVGLLQNEHLSLLWKWFGFLILDFFLTSLPLTFQKKHWKKFSQWHVLICLISFFISYYSLPYFFLLQPFDISQFLMFYHLLPLFILRHLLQFSLRQLQHLHL